MSPGPRIGLTVLVTAPDGATTVAVHDSVDRGYDAACSVHGRFLTILYSPAITVTDLQRTIDRIVQSAAEHAAEHATDALDRS